MVGHHSAAGRAQDSESLPVRDWRSTTVLCHATNMSLLLMKLLQASLSPDYIYNWQLLSNIK